MAEKYIIQDGETYVSCTAITKFLKRVREELGDVQSITEILPVFEDRVPPDEAFEN